ncbi:probable LRR receptor-like serine/threonine-protein kinase At2g16250 [Phragmites australis]|uniref:probable LRR receptor-like serine/threonine-protein kinase At2g16250 n=1 Tax=Phragmites australis TaxID=29695 RepID=UPI002D797EEC|nr:probable LRR receptor-like serine/threonine-protein kinase At2g16250 [Phragmites australis]
MPLRRLLLVVVVLAAAAAAVAQTQQLASRTDVAGLYSLRGSLGLRARDWPAKSDPCAAWAGVACRAGRVVAVTVAGLRRTRLGALAPRFALDGLRNLTAIERFNASGFPLPGEMPAWFGRGLPPSLAVLDLRSATVSGALPADLGTVGNLTTLLLSGNNFSGPVPASLLSIKGLRFLDLSRNNFTGKLPNISVVAGDGAASLFNISGNSLYGVPGDAIGALRRRFQVVDVSSNYFDGAWNGSDGTVVVTMNCFSGVPGQRSRVDCEEFYRKDGVRLVDAPAPSPSPQPSPEKKQRISKNLLIAVLAAAAALIVVFFFALVFFLSRKKRRRRRRVGSNADGSRSVRRRDSSVNPVMSSSPAAVSPRANAGPKYVSAVFGELTFEQLVHATGGFGDDKLIKHGHSGDVYHGVLENGSHVIIKKVGAKGLNKHTSELDFYSRYSHERIVPLLGHLAKDDEEFLAYKHMPKGDLTNALHKKPVDTADGLPSLDWITRLKIATGVAEAMCFLHDECSPPLVHRDIQASSVLLDDKFEVRLGSMSDICAQQSGGSQNVFSRMLRSSKSLEKHTSGPPATCSYDVHCFGKVLLELVTGNMGISGPNAAASEESEWLTNTLNHINASDKATITNIIDPLLVVDEDHLEEVWAVAVIAKTCLNSKPSRRPSARYVLRALESPLRVVRASSRSNSARLRSSSSRSSWQSVFQGNRVQSLNAVASSGQVLDRRHSVRSYGSGEEASFSFKRATPEIVPEPVGLEEDDGVV